MFIEWTYCYFLGLGNDETTGLKYFDNLFRVGGGEDITILMKIFSLQYYVLLLYWKHRYQLRFK